MSASLQQIRERRIVHRTRGGSHGGLTRLMSPSDLGERLKPFVFLDQFDLEPSAFPNFGRHPHSGIATLTWLWEGGVHYEDTSGATGMLPAGGVEWFKAARGAWHGGGPGESRTRGFQLWIALPPDQELGPVESRYLAPAEIPRAGPVSVLLGSHGGVSSPLAPPSPATYLAVRLKAGETWRFAPFAGQEIAWVALASGRLVAPDLVEAGELAVFERSAAPIDFRAEADTEFVLGAAAPHPHDLVLGYYSVHTSPEALRAAEQRIAEIGVRLREEGARRA